MKTSQLPLYALLVVYFLLTPAALFAAEPGIYMLFVWGTNDPGVRNAVEISQRKMEAAFVEDNSSYARQAREELLQNTAGGLVSLNPYIKEKRTLTGNDAHPQKILDACEELANKAGPNDAVMVYILCHGATLKGYDGKKRHILAPIATSADDLSVTIARGSIMQKIKSKSHRLDMLITDSCSVKAPDLREPNEDTENGIPGGETNPYLYNFLLKARGSVNINSSRPEIGTKPAESARSLQSSEWSRVPASPEKRDAYEKFAGTVFINAFLSVAELPEFSESDLTTEQFFRKLRTQLDNQYASTIRYLYNIGEQTTFDKFRLQSTQTLVRFNYDSEAYPPDLDFESAHLNDTYLENGATGGF